MHNKLCTKFIYKNKLLLYIKINYYYIQYIYRRTISNFNVKKTINLIESVIKMIILVQ